MKKIIKKLIEKKKITKIDYYFAKEIDEKKNDPLILIISIYISYSYRKGNTCISLKKIFEKKFFSKNILKKINYKNNIKKELLKNKNISEIHKNSPLIIENNYLYLHKIWHIENKIYKFFTNSYKIKNSSNKLKKILKNKIFIKLNLEQKIVVILCILEKFFFILGDPGTGKTTLIGKIIYFYIYILKKKNIVLSSPTGKASAKLLESIKKNLFFFKKKKYKKYIPNISFTIHRLFKIYKKNNIFLNKIQKKNIDLLIIDESSMIDIFMLEKIIDYTKKKTQIIFLGDHHQLPAINAGSIIHDILFFYKKINKKKLYSKLNYYIKKKNIKNKKIKITHKVFILKKKYRFHKNSDINICSQIIKKKKTDQIKNIINNKFKKISFFTIKKKFNSYKNMIKKIFNSFKNFFLMIKKKKSIKKILKYFNKKRILCVIKNSFYGIKGVNKIFKKLIQKKYPENFFYVNEKIWYLGKPIIILKNLKNMDLFNGSIGITLMNKNYEKKIYFLMPNKKIKIIPINLLPKHKTTWAITVHKSQGSEFSKIYLILPTIRIKIMTREIIYTAITRAKKCIYIFSKKSLFIHAIKKKRMRKSGLYKKFKNTKI